MKTFTKKSMIIMLFALVLTLIILPSVVFADGEEVTLRATANPSEGGSVRIDSTQVTSMIPWMAGSVNATVGETHTYTAQPNPRYAFKEWQNSSGETVSTSNPYQFVVTEDTTLTAVFVREHTVTFNSNNGSQVPSQTVIRGNTAERPEDPTRDGYVFVNWYSDRQLRTEFDFSTEITSSITLYAKWKRAYTVTFDSNGGSEIESQKVGEGDKTIAPEDPTREGYEFIGWSRNSAIINENTGILTGSLFDFNTSINRNTTLVANWAKKHTVSFDSLTVPFEVDPILVTAGESIPEVVGSIIPEYFRSYKLIGLYIDSNFETEYSGEAIVQDTIIYLKWEIDPTRLISEINITIENPTVGDEVTIEKDEYDDYIWGSQKPQLEITIPEDANYKLSNGDGDSNYMYWMTSLDDENYWDPFIGKIEPGKDYYVEVVLLANQGYFFSDNVVIKVNDKIVNKVYYNDGYDISFGAVLTTDEAVFEYVILEGENQIHIVSSGEDLTVKTNGDISKFEGLKVDGVLLDASKYRVVSGSTIATLNQDYLDTLEEGKHTLTFVYTDGEVSTEFSIAKASTTKSPKTGDNVEIYAILMLVSALGITGAIKLLKKD